MLVLFDQGRAEVVEAWRREGAEVGRFEGFNLANALLVGGDSSAKVLLIIH